MGLRLIKWVGSAMLLLSFVVHLITREVSAPMQIAGCICFSCAFLLFWATIRVHRQQPPSLAFSQEASHHIVDTGPYRYIRHPFYTSYFLGWVANGLISESLLLLVPLICMGVLYVSAARLEERQFLGGELSGLYAPYMQRTKMFVPFVV